MGQCWRESKALPFSQKSSKTFLLNSEYNKIRKIKGQTCAVDYIEEYLMERFILQTLLTVHRMMELK